MHVATTPLDGVLLLTPRVFGDERGYFLEAWNQRSFDEVVGERVTFVQDNRSRSARGVLLGLHYQLPPAAQGKLVSVLEGSIYDVVLDLRPDAKTFGQPYGVELRAEDHTMIWAPPGLAHGFLVTSPSATIAYKTTDYYSPQHERGIRWDDPQLAIAWPRQGMDPILSPKDAVAPPLAEADLIPAG